MELFTQLGVSTTLAAAVARLGFEKPTPIQEKAIPVLLANQQDFIGLASTGTGKTAAFGLPLLQQTDESLNYVQGLVIAPTRELCLQITADLSNFSNGQSNLSVVAVYGGASIDTQIRQLKRGAHIIVATPGRLIDLIDRGAARIEQVKYVVLDEADEMLNMGFKEDIDSILSTVGDQRRIWLFSATMPPGVKAISNNFMVKPLEVSVGTANATNVNITHDYYLVRARDRYAALKRIVDFQPEIFGIIFTRTKIEAQDIAEKLIKDGYEADSLHGDLSQGQRDKVMGRFRERALQLLVATDVAARGIDVDNVTHVINYGLPDELEVYTHRSGRTARAGKTGISISIVYSKDSGKIKQIEKITKAKFNKREIPDGSEICQRQLLNLIHKVKGVEVDEKAMENLLPAVFAELDGLTRDDVVKRFVALEFNRFIQYYQNSEDLNISAEEAMSGRRERGSRYSFQRVFISLGELDGVDKQGMLKFINSLKLGRIEIGRIEIKRAFSFVEIEEELANEFLDRTNGYMYDGRPVKAELAGDRPQGSRDKGGRRSSDKGRGMERDFTPQRRSSDDSYRSEFKSDRGRSKSPAPAFNRSSNASQDHKPKKVNFSLDFDKLFADDVKDKRKKSKSW